MRVLLSTAFALTLALPVAATTLTETLDRTVGVKPGSTVTLRNVNGGVTVSSWEQASVRIVAKKRVRADKDDASQVMRNLVVIESRNGGVLITTREPKHDHSVSSILDWIFGDHVETHVDYDLTVPRSMNVDVDNTNGTIRVTDVMGMHKLETTNGKIEVSRCSGAIDASTTNGSIHANMVRIAKGQPIRLETTNGRIELTVPRDLAADVDASTTNGAIKTDLPVATTRFSKNSLRGTINGGGTQVRLSTTNGGIAIIAN